MTPRLRPARCIAQVTAFSASFCSFVSIVRVEGVAGLGFAIRRQDLELAALAASRSTVSCPYTPRSVDS